ncbi:uncharacterized protein LOC113859329 [Abrus precatorius]|uniref:Uncharacterized protein LOC113859329 n=1 Tax=Abrus precatorius TaxID=3816 RepID=A0A8B8KVG3_ABRPR|nr:uncharacterized protein LOC113859329 [Abrus precatorius]
MEVTEVVIRMVLIIIRVKSQIEEVEVVIIAVGEARRLLTRGGFNKSHQKRDDDEAYMAQDGDSDSDRVFLMVTTAIESGNTEIWYLDIGCSNHMTNHKEWLADLDESKKGKVRFVDNRTLLAEGVGNVTIKGRSGKSAFISNVLHVLEMKNNLLSLGQLPKKGFTMHMQ